MRLTKFNYFLAKKKKYFLEILRKKNNSKSQKHVVNQSKE